MSMCRECWDPVADPDAELCDWCSLSASERKARMRRNWLLLLAFVAIATALVLSGCATPSEPRVIVRTERVEVPVPTPVPVSPSLTTPTECPELPPERLNGEALIDYIEALEGCACARAEQLAGINHAHGDASQPEIRCTQPD